MNDHGVQCVVIWQVFCDPARDIRSMSISFNLLRQVSAQIGRRSMVCIAAKQVSIALVAPSYVRRTEPLPCLPRGFTLCAGPLLGSHAL
jgi:hypothetical protein